MNRLFILLLSTMLMLSCIQQKGMLASLPLEKELPTEISFAPTFNIFWFDLCEETSGLKNMKKYQPSDDMRKRYSIVKDGKDYMVTGFLKVNTNFDKELFESYGGKLVEFSATRYTFSFPINNIDKIFVIGGIELIELANTLYQQ